MPIKWKLFAIANYILLAGYLFLFVMALKFIFEVEHASGEMIRFLSIVFCILIIILNSLINIYVFHKFMPGKPFTYILKIFYLVSTILFILSLGVILVSLFPLVRYELQSGQSRKFAYLLTLIFFLTLVIGIFVIINQLLVPAYIKKRSELSFDQMIDDIGR